MQNDARRRVNLPKPPRTLRNAKMHDSPRVPRETSDRHVHGDTRAANPNGTALANTRGRSRTLATTCSEHASTSAFKIFCMREKSLTNHLYLNTFLFETNYLLIILEISFNDPYFEVLGLWFLRLSRIPKPALVRLQWPNRAWMGFSLDRRRGNGLSPSRT